MPSVDSLDVLRLAVSSRSGTTHILVMRNAGMRGHGLWQRLECSPQRFCRVVAGLGAFTTIWALMEMGGYGPVWQDPCTGRCAVGLCFVYDLGWRLQDKLRDFSAPQSSFLLSPKGGDVDPSPDVLTRCQMEWWIFFDFEIQTEQYSTNLMRSACVCSVLTVM